MTTFSTADSPPSGVTSREFPGRDRRWMLLVVLSLGVLMIMLDTTVVNVALPSIRADLKFTDASLVWVVNAYLIPFGGALLVGGRLGDLYSYRRSFLLGILSFTLASLACGLANMQGLLIAARAAQGLGGAVVMAVTLALIMKQFVDPVERGKAFGVYSFVGAGGGSLGLLVGGLLTSALNWHWVFLINLPVGGVIYWLSHSMLDHDRRSRSGRLGLWAPGTLMGALMLALCAIVNGNESGWMSFQTAGLLGGTGVLLALFVLVETRSAAPLVPLGIFKLRQFAVANIIGVLWTAAGNAWFFIAALYMQRVLGYRPGQIAVAFLPWSLISATFALGLSARLVRRFGVRNSLLLGLTLITVGLALLARVPLEGSVVTDILPGMVLLGLGAGLAYNPLLLAAMHGTPADETGLASGIFNTACMVGGALGLAILVTVSEARTQVEVASGTAMTAALADGYRVALVLATVGVGAALLLARAVPRDTPKE